MASLSSTCKVSALLHLPGLQCPPLAHAAGSRQGELCPCPAGGTRRSHCRGTVPSAAEGLSPAQGVLLLLHRAEPNVCQLRGEGLGPGACSAAGAAAVH